MSRSLVVAALALAACQQPRSADPLPKVVKSELALATVAGRVADADGLPISGLIVTVPETDETYTTQADGQYVLKVPAQSSFTLRTFKVGYAGTTTTPLYLEPDQVHVGLDLMVVPSSSIGVYNAQAGADENRGVMAVQVISLSGRCDVTNATVAVLNPESLQPMPGALVLYVKAGSSQPDRTVTTMQSGSRPNAWLVGVPEGQNFPVKLEKAGCSPLSFPVVYQGMTWQPGMRVALKGLTQLPVFVE